MDTITEHTGHYHGVTCPACDSQRTFDAEKFPSGFVICKGCGNLFIRPDA